MSESKTEPASKTVNPLVFISHDTRDAELAEAFSNLLKSVSAGVLKSFRSSDKKTGQGIEFGVEWYPEIIKNIQSASDVVCLLTDNSINRPWILFEAGMAKGKLDTPILGVALGIELKDASTGPFAQFQNCGDDEDSLTKLFTQLVARIPGAEPDKDTIKFQVGKFKGQIADIIKKGKSAHAVKSKPVDGASSNQSAADLENSSVKLFEEIKIMFKDLPLKIEKANNGDGIRRRRRLHPKMIDELMHVTRKSSLGIRMALSLYREKFPWIYDEGTQILNKFITGKHTQSSHKRAMIEMEELLLVSTRTHLFEVMMEDEMDFVMMKELPRLIMGAMERIAFETKDSIDNDLK